MDKNLVITLIGKDNIGIVNHVTNIILTSHGNITESKMARLGGEFTMLMLISVAEDNLSQLEQAISALQKEGYQLFYKETEKDTTEKFSGWLPYEIVVTGADHEGIINHVTAQLSDSGMNIESIDTRTSPAPMSGTALFTMTAVVLAPPQKTLHTWAEKLDEVADEMNVDIDIYNYKG